MTQDHAEPLLSLVGVEVRTPDGVALVTGITWAVRPSEHWALLGPNGAGKSTLLSVATGQRHPSRGTATLLGQRFGSVDLRDLRARVGVVDHTLRIPPGLAAADVVLTGQTGSVHLVRGRYSDSDRARARDLLERVGCGHLANRPTGTWSHGERARVRLARAMMPAPSLLLLDEPASGLDLPGREDLVTALSELAGDHPNLATVLVTHHLEELPPTITHAMLLRDGATVASGAAASVLSDDPISRCFGRPIAVHRMGDRWVAQATGPADKAPQETRAALETRAPRIAPGRSRTVPVRSPRGA